MVDRIYVEKRNGFDIEAQQLLAELRDILGVSSLKRVRLINRYDIEGIDPELFDVCKTTVFSEPQVDQVFNNMDDVLAMSDSNDQVNVFAVEYSLAESAR